VKNGPAGHKSVWRANLSRLASCGLSEYPPPRPAPLARVHVPVSVRVQVRRHVITRAEISFAAPYAVTSASQDYFVSARRCPRGLVGGISDADVAAGAPVVIDVTDLLSGACGRSVNLDLTYTRYGGGIPQSTPLGTVTIHEPPGSHAERLPVRR
jgi:hypothetical protein